MRRAFYAYAMAILQKLAGLSENGFSEQKIAGARRVYASSTGTKTVDLHCRRRSVDKKQSTKMVHVDKSGWHKWTQMDSDRLLRGRTAKDALRNFACLYGCVGDSFRFVISS